MTNSRQLYVYLLPAGSAPREDPGAVGYAGANVTLQLFPGSPRSAPIRPGTLLDVAMMDAAPLRVIPHMIASRSDLEVIVMALPEAPQKQIADAALVAQRAWLDGRLGAQKGEAAGFAHVRHAQLATR